MNNCLSCNNWKSSESYNTPIGTASELTSAYSGTLANVALDDQLKMNNLNPVNIDDLLYKRTVEPPKGNYLPPLMDYKSTC